jgi:GNAT superfamily N-acetyltransferase
MKTDEPELKLSVEPEAAEADCAAVRQGLQNYNNRFIHDDGFVPLTLFIRKEDGGIVGGLLGEMYWGWLHISIFWLDDAIRGKGYGTKLLQMAEEEARRRGCAAVHLDTMSFQAQPFYEKNGYTVFGVLDDLPVGQQRIYLWKKL